MDDRWGKSLPRFCKPDAVAVKWNVRQYGRVVRTVPGRLKETFPKLTTKKRRRTSYSRYARRKRSVFGRRSRYRLNVTVMSHVPTGRLVTSDYDKRKRSRVSITPATLPNHLRSNHSKMTAVFRVIFADVLHFQGRSVLRVELGVRITGRPSNCTDACDSLDGRVSRARINGGGGTDGQELPDDSRWRGNHRQWTTTLAITILQFRRTPTRFDRKSTVR